MFPVQMNSYNNINVVRYNTFNPMQAYNTLAMNAMPAMNVNVFGTDRVSFSPQAQAYMNGGFAGMQQAQMMMAMGMMMMSLMQSMGVMGNQGTMNQFGQQQNAVNGLGNQANNATTNGNAAPGANNAANNAANNNTNAAANPNTQIPDFGKNATKQQIGQQLSAAASKYGIPENILKAVAWQESNWNPKALSFDGQHGKGVMQIDDRFHQFARTQEVFDPAKNIDYGAKFLKDLYAETGSWEAALKRYNGGSSYPPKIMGLAQSQPWNG